MKQTLLITLMTLLAIATSFADEVDCAITPDSPECAIESDNDSMLNSDIINDTSYEEKVDDSMETSIDSEQIEDAEETSPNTTETESF